MQFDIDKTRQKDEMILNLCPIRQIFGLRAKCAL